MHAESETEQTLRYGTVIDMGQELKKGIKLGENLGAQGDGGGGECDFITTTETWVEKQVSLRISAVRVKVTLVAKRSSFSKVGGKRQEEDELVVCL